MPKDCRGLAVTAVSDDAMASYDALVTSFMRFGQDILPRIDATLALDPEMILARCFQASLHLLRGLGPLVPKAKAEAAWLEAHADRGNARERGHIAALGAWCRGEMERAAEIWDAILLDHPRDIMAMKLVHYARFYLGGGPAFRDSLLRTLHAWDESVAGYGFVLGMQSFALEETGDYAGAEAAGKRAIEIDPKDGWATHAVTHVLEMQERRRESIAWIEALKPHWQAENNFRYHIWWHLALVHLALGDADGVLRLYDEALWDPKSEEYLDLCNDVSLLARLELAGLDVGERWKPLAEKIRSRTQEHILTFVDFHYVMALAAAGLRDEAEAMLDSLNVYARKGSGTNAVVAGDVGVPLCRGLLDHRQGRYAEAVERLMPIRYDIYKIGGSHAQRDLLAMILIDAAVKAGQDGLARALLSERVAQRPKDPWSWRAYAGALGKFGDSRAADKAMARARSALA